MAKTRNKIYVTGLGPISSLGVGVDQTWGNAVDGRVNISLQEERIDGEKVFEYYAHRVPEQSLSRIDLSKNKLREIEAWSGEGPGSDLRLLLYVIKVALEDSQLVYPETNNRIGLVLTCESPFHGELYKKFLSFCVDSEKKEITPTKLFDSFFSEFNKIGYDLQSFALLFHVARFFNVHGFSLYINNACASGMYAIEVAADALISNKCEAVIVAAVDSPNVFKAKWFYEMGFQAKSKKTFPFLKDSSGFNMGEGGAALVLEREESANKRGAKVYAEYLGGEFMLESWKVTLPHVTEKYYLKNINNLLRKLKIKPSDVDLVVPHGTGIDFTDKYEGATLLDLFSGSPDTVFTCYKHLLGHNLGGSTLIEIVLMILSLQKGELIPMKYIHKREYGLNFVTDHVEKDLSLGLKTCTAFAGFNAASLFKSIKK